MIQTTCCQVAGRVPQPQGPEDGGGGEHALVDAIIDVCAERLPDASKASTATV